MIKTRPGYFSRQNGVLLMHSDQGHLVPYVHADTIVEWLEEHDFDKVAEPIRKDIIRAFEEYAAVKAVNPDC